MTQRLKMETAWLCRILLQLAEMMVEELEAKKLTAEIVDSDELAEYMEANPQGIYIITQGNTPGTIFKKEGKKDLVYTWLRGGGIGGFIGDYAFYYYWDKGRVLPPPVPDSRASLVPQSQTVRFQR